MAEIDALNRKIRGIKVLKGAEVNILKDGTLDIDDETLAQLDVVGIAVHSHFGLPREEMTRRVIRAMENPHADILFHPTGRKILTRPPYEIDIDALIQAAKRTGTVLEVDAYPDRLDLKDEQIRKAVESGVKLVIDSDAHNVRHLSYLSFGAAAARRGWAKRSDILNTHARRIPRPLGARVRRANTNRFFSFRVEDSPLLAAGSFNTLPLNEFLGSLKNRNGRKNLSR